MFPLWKPFHKHAATILKIFRLATADKTADIPQSTYRAIPMCIQSPRQHSVSGFCRQLLLSDSFPIAFSPTVGTCRNGTAVCTARILC
ncbi:hypothetical protein RP20_CCG026051 [Aedes albopictus]|nr:hypothetical protein RP20_CCG026051 [Aedes albopictus]